MSILKDIEYLEVYYILYLQRLAEFGQNKINGKMVPKENFGFGSGASVWNYHRKFIQAMLEIFNISIQIFIIIYIVWTFLDV